MRYYYIKFHRKCICALKAAAPYKRFGLLILIMFNFSEAYTQKTENQGWVLLTHTQRLNKRFDLLADAQGRTAHQFDYANTLLLRTGLSYNLNKKQSVAVGYAYKGDREKENDIYEYSNENRLFQQYLGNLKLAKIEMTLRGRLEQRWVKEVNTDFSQRARIFISVQIPLFADPEFTRGVYAGAQNELFLNVTHKHRANNSTFDQNRSFLSAGYRWGKAIDTEIGYMYWYQKEMNEDFRRTVIQLQVTTSF